MRRIPRASELRGKADQAQSEDGDHPMESQSPHEEPAAVRRCGARARHGGTCRQFAMSNGRCKYHGGRSPWGPGNGNWKHGRYSKYLPRRLRDRVAEMLADPDHLSLKSEIALSQAHICELLSKMTDDGDQQTWEGINTAIERLRRLVETEARLLQERQMTVTVEQAEALAMALIEIMYTHVPEPDRRRRIMDAARSLKDRYYLH